MGVILKDDLTDDGTARASSGIGRRASPRLSHRVDNGMGNDGTKDGTAWAGAQATQLFPVMWMGCKISNCIG